MHPMHPTPSCYTERQTKAQEKRGDPLVRVANIFHRDKPGVLVFQLRGGDYNVDRMAELIAAGTIIPPEQPPPPQVLTVDDIPKYRP